MEYEIQMKRARIRNPCSESQNSGTESLESELEDSESEMWYMELRI